MRTNSHGLRASMPKTATNLELPMKETHETRKCPLCKSESARFLCTVDNYQIWRCPQCALDFVSPVPDEAFLKTYYDRKDWFEGGERGGYESYDQQTGSVLPVFLDLLAYYEQTCSGRYILDVGCGYATHLALAADRGWKAFGVEVSAHALQVARQRHGNKIFLVDQIEALVPCEFDLILLFDVIEHTRDPFSLFFKLFSLGAIGPKTQIAITTPNARSRSAVSDPAKWAYRHPPSHLFFYSAEALQRLMTTLHFGKAEVTGLHPDDSLQEAAYEDEFFSKNCKLQSYAGLLCQASGSDFKEFMHERFVPGTWSKIAEYEHRPRYIFAQKRVSGARVLDFGCGTGYGSSLLADVADQVLGVDIDTTALGWASQFHNKPNLKFQTCSDFARSLPAGSFDVITCFELIEHLNEEGQREFMENARRLLAPGGELIISTPNPAVTANYGENPYHLREMNEEEFRDLLGSYFHHVQILGQWIRPSIAITAQSEVNQAVDFYELKTDQTGAQIPVIPSNYVAVCSQQPFRQSRELCYFDSSFDYVAAAVKQENKLHQSQFETYRLQEIAANQENTITVQEAALRRDVQEITSLQQEVTSLQQRAQTLDAELTGIKQTKVYRLRHTILCDPFSLRKLVKITYLVVAMLTPRRVRQGLRPVANKLREKIFPPPKTKESSTKESFTLMIPKVKPDTTTRITHVSVVIPTKNAGPLFAQVLDQIKAQKSLYPFDITIIDSGSTDETVALAKDRGANVIVISPDQFNHGLTRNMAIENTSGEVVVLLTQDAVPGDDKLIQNLIKAFDDPLVAGIYGRQVPRPEADVLTSRNLNSWLTGRIQPEVRFVDDAAKYSSMTPYERYKFCNFDNVCSAVRRSVWKEISFPANDFAEDLEWGKRIVEAGWKIAYEPTAYVVHSHDRSLSYEFKRTYLCHIKLYSLFGVCTVPSWGHLVAYIIKASFMDWVYVCKNESHFWKCLSLLANVPLLNSVAIYAQYRGAKDQKLLRNRKIEGV